MSKLLCYVIIFFISANALAGISEHEFENEYCGGNCEEQLMVAHMPSDLLSTVEHFLVQKYTEGNIILDREMFIQAIAKIPTSTLVVYRGTSKERYKIQKSGQIIQFSGITSVSAERVIAENFIKDQLLVIKAKSAHSILRYSVVGENELILLPGTRLHVDRIYTEKIDLSYEGENPMTNVQVVELTEL